MKPHIIFFIFLVFFKESFCLDTFYDDCIPQHCGNVTNIRFPFFIGGSQESFCGGYPGFELHCNESHFLSIQISENNYLVTDIDYEEHSMRLLYASSITCFLEIKNATLNQFRIEDSTTSKLIFLTDCSKEVPKNLTRYTIRSCDPAVQMVMLNDDTNLGNAKEVCNGAVEVLVGKQNGKVVDGRNFAEVMKRGFTMFWDVPPYCIDCELSGGRCGSFKSQFLCFCPNNYSNNTADFLCFCPVNNSTGKGRCPANNGTINKKLVILISALSVGYVTLMVAIVLCFKRKLKWKRKTNKNVNVEIFLQAHKFLGKRYSYSEVKKMTNSFKVKVGEGGFGSVYRGVLSNGDLVAVKILSELKGNSQDFINEVASVGKTSHVNIVSLVGFCFEGHERALIYEFMPNGSLEKFIYDRTSSSKNQLGWEKLHKIAIGIARGLEYLHSGCNTQILHFDIKPHNILLDHDFSPKISDFGLAKLFHEKRSMISMSRMRGTPGYIAPEVYSRNFGQVSHKSDVYSYGMMILEMVGGRKNIEVGVDHTSEVYFPHWIYKKVELNEKLELHENMSDEENVMARKMIVVGLWCIQTNPLSRPTITKALEMLEGDLESLEIPPKPYLSSPSRSIGSAYTD